MYAQITNLYVYAEIKVRNLSPPIGWNVMTEHVSLVSDIDDNLDINSSSVYTQPPREHGNVTMLLLNSSFPYVFQW